MSDRRFFSILVTLVVIFSLMTVILVVLANVVGSPVAKGKEELTQIELEDRVKKTVYSVGQVVVGDTPIVEKVEEEQVSNAPLSGEQVYQRYCVICHASGVANAPKLGDVAGWRSRLIKGRETLYNSAISGLGLMPPKGGNMQLTDDEVKAAVDYLLEASR